jgi:hypothetical protein
MFLIGNDFLPKCAALGNMNDGISALFRVYRSLGKPLTNGTTIIYRHFVEYLALLAKEEDILMTEIAKLKPKYPNRMVEYATTTIPKADNTYEYILDYQKFRDAWYQNAIGAKCSDSFIEDVTDAIPDLEYPPIYPDTSVIEKMCRLYLRGILWIYKYYLEGPDNLSNVFMYPFAYAPILRDLAAMAAVYEPSVDTVTKGSDDINFTVAHQQLIVLPRSSKNIAIKEIRTFFNKNSIIRDLMPPKFIVERDGKNSDHHPVVIVPPSDPYRVHNAVATVVDKFSDKSFKNIFGKHRMLPIDLLSQQIGRQDITDLRKKIELKLYGNRGNIRGRGENDRGRGTRGSSDRGNRGNIRGRGENDRSRGSSDRGNRGNIRGRGENDRGRGSYRGEGNSRGNDRRGRGRGSRDNPPEIHIMNAQPSRPTVQAPRQEQRSTQEKPAWGTKMLL